MDTHKFVGAKMEIVENGKVAKVLKHGDTLTPTDEQFQRFGQNLKLIVGAANESSSNSSTQTASTKAGKTEGESGAK